VTAEAKAASPKANPEKAVASLMDAAPEATPAPARATVAASATVEPVQVPFDLVEVAPIAAPIVSAQVVLGSQAPALRQAMSEAVAASAQGALAVNGKIIDALQVQGHAALDLWRSSVSTPHLPEVLRLQSSGARHAYETASAQWKDIAETTAHWFTKTVEPISSALTDRRR
jgi:hypothetical protein